MMHSRGPPSVPGAGENPAHPSNPLSYLIAASPATTARARAHQQALLRSNGHLGTSSRETWNFSQHANQPVQRPATNAIQGSFETNYDFLFGCTVPPATNTLPSWSFGTNNDLLPGRTVSPATSAFQDASFETNYDFPFGCNVPPAINALPSDTNYDLLPGRTVPTTTNAFPAGSFDTSSDFLFGCDVPPATNTLLSGNFGTNNDILSGCTVAAATNALRFESIDTSYDFLFEGNVPPPTNALPSGSFGTNNDILSRRTVPPAMNALPSGSFGTNNDLLSGRTELALPATPTNGPRPLLFSALQQLPAPQRPQVQSSHHILGNGTGRLPPLVGARLPPHTWVAAPNSGSSGAGAWALMPRAGSSLPPQTWADAPDGGSAGAVAGAERLPPDQGVARFAPQPLSSTDLVGNYGACHVPTNHYPAGRSAPLPAPRPQPPLVRAGALASFPAVPERAQEDGKSFEEFLVECGVLDDLIKMIPSPPHPSTFSAPMGAVGLGGVDRGDGPVSGIAGRQPRPSTLVTGLGGVLSAEPKTGLDTGTTRVTEASGPAAMGARGTIRLHPTGVVDMSAAAAAGGRRTPRLLTTAEETSGAAAVGGRGIVRLRRLTAEEAMSSRCRGRSEVDDAKKRRVKRITKRRERTDARSRTPAGARGSPGDGSGSQGASGSSSSWN